MVSDLHYHSKNPLYDRKRKIQFQIKGEDNSEGRRGPLAFSLPDENGAALNDVYLQGKFGPKLIAKICQNMHYSKGRLIRESSSDSENIPVGSLTYHVDNKNKGDQKFCAKIFAKIVGGQEINAEEILDIRTRCIKEESKQHIRIECTGAVTKTSLLTAQNSCGVDGTCPTGFSQQRSKNDTLESEKSVFCLPNQCYDRGGKRPKF